MKKTCVKCEETKDNKWWYKGPKCGKCYRAERPKYIRDPNYLKEYEQRPERRRKRNIYQRDYHKNNDYNKKYHRRFKTRFNRAKRDAKNRNWKWEFTFEEYKKIIQQPCEYCGDLIDNMTGSGLDRKNSDLGYLKNNIVPCCTACNRIKNKELSYNEMKIAMKAVLEYRKSNGEDMTGLVVVEKGNR